VYPVCPVYPAYPVPVVPRPVALRGLEEKKSSRSAVSRKKKVCPLGLASARVAASLPQSAKPTTPSPATRAVASTATPWVGSYVRYCSSPFSFAVALGASP